MKWLNDYRMKLMLIGFVAAVALSGGRANADFTFGTPSNLGLPVNSSSDDGGSTSFDGLTLFFESDRPGGSGSLDIWVTTRVTKNELWGEPVNLGPTVNSSSFDFAPCISANGLELYFTSDRSGTFGIWVATRGNTEDDWDMPVSLGSKVNSSSYNADPSISTDGLSLYFTSNRTGKYGAFDLWVTTRSTVSDPWGTPENLGSMVNSQSYDNAPSISSDGLSLFFDSDRAGGQGDVDVWMTRRASLSEPWEEPVNLGPTVNRASAECAPSISSDGMELYFNDYFVQRTGGVGKSDVWQVSIEPIVDLNADGIVDAADLCIIVDNWGTDNQLCDIGPMPWGDGVVDVEDLIVLAEHLFEEVPPAEPIE